MRSVPILRADTSWNHAQMWNIFFSSLTLFSYSLVQLLVTSYSYFVQGGNTKRCSRQFGEWSKKISSQTILFQCISLFWGDLLRFLSAAVVDQQSTQQLPHFIQLIFVIVLIESLLAAKITYRGRLLMNIDSLR